MRKLLDSYDDRMMVGETYLPNDELMKYYGTTDMLECHLPFNFQLILAKWLAPGVRKMVDDYEAVLPGMPGPTGCSATTTSTGSPGRTLRRASQHAPAYIARHTHILLWR